MKTKEMSPWFDLLKDAVIALFMFIVLSYIGVRSDRESRNTPDIQVVVHKTVWVTKK